MDRKKIKIILISTAGVLLAGTAVWFGMTKFKKATVSVYSMEELIQPVFGDMPSLEGSVSTSVSQQVHLADQQIVREHQAYPPKIVASVTSWELWKTLKAFSIAPTR